MTLEDLVKAQIDSVLDQAARYGRQVRELEDADRNEDRMNARRAWEGFRNQLSGALRAKAVDCYWNEYCQSGFRRTLP